MTVDEALQKSINKWKTQYEEIRNKRGDAWRHCCRPDRNGR